MARVDIDVTAATAYVARARADGDKRVTVMHVLGVAAAHALRQVPEANARVLAGRVVPFPEITVGFAVDVRGEDLAPALIGAADAVTIPAMAAATGERVERLRTGQDAGFRRSATVARLTPTALLRPALLLSSLVLGGLGRPFLGQPGHPLGSIFISNVGALGFDEVFLAPVPFARTAVYLSLGRVRDLPVVVAGALVTRPSVTVCMTGDHRLYDGVQASRFVRALEAGMSDPDALDQVAAGRAAGGAQ